MIQSRLRPRLKSLKMREFDDYIDFVCSKNGEAETKFLISALTTNVSHFFREEHHFDLMIEYFESMITSGNLKSNRLRIWSAGCSNGQETYSIIMSILERIPTARKVDVKILATDIDPKVVSFANSGCYHGNMLSNISEELLEKYFIESGNSSYTVNQELKSRAVFRELNLLGNWPMKNCFDVIFCRNVVIYFDQETQQKLWPRFREKLTDNGKLFIGHSERMVAAESFGFKTCGPTAYEVEPRNVINKVNEVKETHDGTT